MSESLLVRGAAVLTMVPGEGVRDDCDVLVRDGVIQAVGSSLPADGARVLDGRDRVCMPGLVNAHTHLVQVLVRGIFEGMGFLEWLRNVYAMGNVAVPADLRQGARLGLLEAIKGGVTSVMEHNFLHPSLECADAGIEGFRELGVRGVYGRAFLDGGELVPQSITEPAERAATHLSELRRRYRELESSGMLRFAIAPNTPAISASEEGVRQAAEFARREGFQITMHVAETPVARDRWNGCVRRLEQLGALGTDVLMAHCVHLFPDEIETVARTGTWVSSNPVSNLFLGDGIPPIAELLAAKANIVFGTDGAASNNTQDMWETLKVATILQRGAKQDGSLGDPMTMLGQVTREAAKALGFGGVCGTLEPGRRADLILVDLTAVHSVAVHRIPSALVHTVKNTDVVATVVDGRLLMDERRVLVADEAEVKRSATAQAHDLVRRVRESYGTR